MAPKKKQQQQQQQQHLSSNNEANSLGATPWPVLPQQLTMLVGEQPQLFNNVSWGGVSKSWRTVPRQCSSAAKAPWLELSEANDNSTMMELNQQCCHNILGPHALSIDDYPGSNDWSGRRGWRWQERWQHYVGHSHGLLVTDKIHCTHIPEPDEPFERSIPHLNIRIPLISATLGFRSTQNSTILVITGISSPAFVIFRPADCREKHTLMKYDCTMVDPYASEALPKPMAFTNAVGFKEKFYALSSQGTLALIEEVASQFRITGLGKNRAVPSVPSKHFMEYLMDSKEKILLVFLISRKSIHTIDDVEVFQLDLSRLAWTKMESLGDRALFIGTKCSMSVAASQVGCKSNHVYFTHCALDCWKEYNMENGSISPCAI